ncbi:hypothetical protein E4T56_gene20010 [Termitomyces sp. T112]|nr:hypothetical protein E4T56_gene20010 [Termitomyces sp. T112]
MSFGGWVSGIIFDATGSYGAAFANGVAWNAVNVGIVVTLLIRARINTARRDPLYVRSDARSLGRRAGSGRRLQRFAGCQPRQRGSVSFHALLDVVQPCFELKHVAGPRYGQPDRQGAVRAVDRDEAEFARCEGGSQTEHDRTGVSAGARCEIVIVATSSDIAVESAGAEELDGDSLEHGHLHRPAMAKEPNRSLTPPKLRPVVDPAV